MLNDARYELILFGRRSSAVEAWLKGYSGQETCLVKSYAEYSDCDHDAVVNFVGVGDPARAAEMGPTILDVTLEYDQLILNGLKANPNRKYIFLSSGAAYGSSFLAPVSSDSAASIRINNLSEQEYYAIAKLHAEGRHRSLVQYGIVDIRIFNYFSETVPLDSRFFITDLIRATKNKITFETRDEQMVRDYLHPADFFQLIDKILQAPICNIPIDAYSKKPISKFEILELFKERYGLKVQITDSQSIINATGEKPYYFSENYRASDFGYIPNYGSYDGLINILDEIIPTSG